MEENKMIFSWNSFIVKFPFAKKVKANYDTDTQCES